MNGCGCFGFLVVFLINHDFFEITLVWVDSCVVFDSESNDSLSPRDHDQEEHQRKEWRSFIESLTWQQQEHRGLDHTSSCFAESASNHVDCCLAFRLHLVVQRNVGHFFGGVEQ